MLLGMANPDGDWSALAQRVVARRGELDLTQQAVYAAGGPSTVTIRQIEGVGRTSYKPLILSRLEKALGWAPGSVRAILAGGEPTLTAKDDDRSSTRAGGSDSVEPTPEEDAYRMLVSMRRVVGSVAFERALHRLRTEEQAPHQARHTDRVGEGL